MSEIIWGKMAPGSECSIADEERGMLILGEPDWVRLPEELGGAVRRVLAIGTGRCVNRDHDHGPVRHFALEGEVWVCECPQSGQFYFYFNRQTGGA